MKKPRRKFLFKNKFNGERIVASCGRAACPDLMLASGSYAIYFSVDQITKLKKYIQDTEKYFKHRGLLK